MKVTELRNELSAALVPGAAVTFLGEVNTSGAILRVSSTFGGNVTGGTGFRERTTCLILSRIRQWVLLMVPQQGLLWTTVGNIVQFRRGRGHVEVSSSPQ